MLSLAEIEQAAAIVHGAMLPTPQHAWPLIAQRTDEIIYVCRFNRAYKKHIRLYVKALRSGRNEVLGIVLNGLTPRRIEYYSNYRYYRSYKKYYGSQT